MCVCVLCCEAALEVLGAVQEDLFVREFADVLKEVSECVCVCVLCSVHIRKYTHTCIQTQEPIHTYRDTYRRTGTKKSPKSAKNSTPNLEKPCYGSYGSDAMRSKTR